MNIKTSRINTGVLLVCCCLFVFFGHDAFGLVPLLDSNGTSTGLSVGMEIESSPLGYLPLCEKDHLPMSWVVEATPEVVGQSGDVYLVKKVGDNWFQLSTKRKWRDWSFELSSLKPFRKGARFDSRTRFSVEDIAPSSVSKIEYYFLVRPNEQNKYFWNHKPLEISISPFPCSNSSDGDLKSKLLHNPAAYIPAQCYTKTKDDNSLIHNPCYVCHTGGKKPNIVIGDKDLQLAYSFPEVASVNHWTNLFEDKSVEIEAIGDDAIVSYVRNDNYHDPNGRPILAYLAEHVPEKWDYNGNGKWDGFVPDCYYSFDQEGFDRTPSGGYSGWRAFAYYPFPGTFWPTNGSTDDVLIRLPEEFRQDELGNYDLEIYKINMAIVEAYITRRDVAITPVDESLYGVDLDLNGRLETARFVKFIWPFRSGKSMNFVGMAGKRQRSGLVHLAAGLFPEGTEFLHSVRYIDVLEDGKIGLAPRMKELRYAKKIYWLSYSRLQEIAGEEAKEKYDFPDRLKMFPGNMEMGISNGQGWVYQGFIEDANGRLRPQSYEETLYCMGCHGGIGATSDGIFSFPRKLDTENSFQQGWYHWTQRGLYGLPEPKVDIEGAGTQYEYSYYLMYNRSGNEFRNNDEVTAKFFDQNGTVNKNALLALHDDITTLLNPSRGRALMLDKAYRILVRGQDFIHGRDGSVLPLETVYQEVTEDTSTGIARPTVTKGFHPNFLSGQNGAGQYQASQANAQLETVILGDGLPGPDGSFYQVDSSGLIFKSDYSGNIKGFYFPFPDRLTLPTRVIVPNDHVSVCYKCHRLDGPVPESNKSLLEQPLQLSSDSKAPGNAIRLTTNAAMDINPVWSPKGNQIVWVSNRSGFYHLWVMNSDGTGKRALTSGPIQFGWPLWSPDGTRVLFQGFDENSKEYLIGHVDVDDPTDVVVVTQGADVLDRPCWSPDGKFIAYASEVEGNWDIYVVSIDGKTSYRLTNRPAMETNPLWSPDGKIIAFKRGGSGNYALTVEDFITFGSDLSKPLIHEWPGPQSIQMNSWSPNGRWIAYTAEAINGASGKDRVSYVAVISDMAIPQEDGSNATALNTSLISQGLTLGDRGPVFSPDSKKVAFWAWDKSFGSSIWVYDLDTKQAKQLTSGGFDLNPKWSPDSRQLVFESSRNGNIDIWVITLD